MRYLGALHASVRPRARQRAGVQDVSVEPPGTGKRGCGVCGRVGRPCAAPLRGGRPEDRHAHSSPWGWAAAASLRRHGRIYILELGTASAGCSARKIKFQLNGVQQHPSTMKTDGRPGQQCPVPPGEGPDVPEALPRGLHVLGSNLPSETAGAVVKRKNGGTHEGKRVN